MLFFVILIGFNDVHVCKEAKAKHFCTEEIEKKKSKLHIL